MLQRYNLNIPDVTIGVTAPANSDEISYGNFTSGMVHLANGNLITELTWYSSPTKGGTYEPAYDYDAVAVTQTVAADHAHPIPLALIGCSYIKAIASGGSAGTVDISLKG